MQILEARELNPSIKLIAREQGFGMSKAVLAGNVSALHQHSLMLRRSFGHATANHQHKKEIQESRLIILSAGATSNSFFWCCSHSDFHQEVQNIELKEGQVFEHPKFRAPTKVLLQQPTRRSFIGEEGGVDLLKRKRFTISSALAALLSMAKQQVRNIVALFPIYDAHVLFTCLASRHPRSHRTQATLISMSPPCDVDVRPYFVH